MKPLSSKIRTASLILMFLIFIIAGPILLLQARGYKFDQVKDVFTLVKTGGIYIQSDISGTNVYVDSEFVKKNGLFLRNILVEELEPDMVHRVLVKKEGYHSWRKQLPVYESLVTEVSLMMIPKEIESREISEYLEIEEDGKEEDLVTNEEYETLMEYFIPEEDEEVLNTDSPEEEVEIPEYFVELGVLNPEELDNLIVSGNEVSWLEDGNVLIHWIGKEDNIPYYYCLTQECRSKLVLDWEDEILSFDFFPGRNDVLIVSVNEGIYAVEVDDRSERNIQPIYLGKDLEWVKTERDRVVVKDENVFHELSF